MARRVNRKPLTDGERDARRQAARDRIEQAARALLTTEGWQRWIKVRASNGLSRYSLGNQMILAIETYRRGITPTYVVGFRAWLQLNRRCRARVRLDGAPVAVWSATSTVRRPAASTCSSGRDRVGPDGPDPLPGRAPVRWPRPREPITGDSHHRLIASLIAHAAELGYSVEIRSSLKTERAAGATPSRARSSSPTDLATSRSTVTHELAQAHGVGSSSARVLGRGLVDCVTCSGAGLRRPRRRRRVDLVHRWLGRRRRARGDPRVRAADRHDRARSKRASTRSPSPSAEAVAAEALAAVGGGGSVEGCGAPMIGQARPADAGCEVANGDSRRPVWPGTGLMEPPTDTPPSEAAPRR